LGQLDGNIGGNIELKAYVIYGSKTAGSKITLEDPTITDIEDWIEIVAEMLPYAVDKLEDENPSDLKLLLTFDEKGYYNREISKCWALNESLSVWKDLLLKTKTELAETVFSSNPPKSL
jgi:hypothetical protein